MNEMLYLFICIIALIILIFNFSDLGISKATFILISIHFLLPRIESVLVLIKNKFISSK